MILLATLSVLAAMNVQEAIVTLLGTPTATSPVRFEEAARLVLRDAKEGKPLQQFVVGVTTVDEELSRTYCDAARPKIRYLAEKKNNPLAWYLLSMETNDLTCLQRAVEGGNVQALNAYGTMLIEQSLNMHTSETNAPAETARRGFDCYLRATRQGDANGYVNLGTCYLRGLGCEVDLLRAHDCFEKAAALGQPEAMDNLSAGYQLGQGVEKNAEKSLYWRMRAKATRGDTAAEAWLKGRE